MPADQPPLEPTAEPPGSSPSRGNRTLPLIGAAFVGLVVLIAIFTSGSGGTDGVDADWKQIQLTTTDGDATTLADFGNAPLVVNFFASWCPPCKAELPDIEAVSKEFDGDVIVIGVNRDQTENAWKALVEESGITYTTVFEGMDGALFEATGGLNMPTTLFISADGEIVHSAVGLQTDESLRNLIDTELLG